MELLSKLIQVVASPKNSFVSKAPETFVLDDCHINFLQQSKIANTNFYMNSKSVKFLKSLGLVAGAVLGIDSVTVEDTCKS